MIAAAAVCFAFVAIAAICAVADWLKQQDRELDRHVTEVLDPIVPMPDWDANEAAFDAMGVKR